jgi:hypothetical protein
VVLTLFPRTQTSLVTIGLLIAAALFGSPNRADAGCGDYLTIVTADGKAVAHHTQTDSSTPQPPCHGPNCSARNAPPPTPISVPIELTSRAKEWAAAVVLVSTDGDSFAQHVLDPDSDQPISRKSEPFHPPRPF